MSQQKKPGFFSYIIGGQYNSQINNGYNLVVKDCLNRYQNKYEEQLKANGGKSDIVSITTTEGEQKTLRSLIDVMQYCNELSSNFVKQHFGEDLSQYNQCIDKCTSDNQDGLLRFVHRISCYKACQQNLEIDSRDKCMLHFE